MPIFANFFHIQRSKYFVIRKFGPLLCTMHEPKFIETNKIKESFSIKCLSIFSSLVRESYVWGSSEGLSDKKKSGPFFTTKTKEKSGFEIKKIYFLRKKRVKNKCNLLLEKTV